MENRTPDGQGDWLPQVVVTLGPHQPEPHRFMLDSRGSTLAIPALGRQAGGGGFKAS